MGDKVVVSGTGDGARFGAMRVGSTPRDAGRRAIGLLRRRALVVVAALRRLVAVRPAATRRSRSATSYELDGKSPPSTSTRSTLGEEAQKLPAKGALLHPLMMKRANDDEGARRPDHRRRRRRGGEHDDVSVGDIPEGATAQLMRASIDELVDGATNGGRKGRSARGGAPGFAVP